MSQEDENGVCEQQTCVAVTYRTFIRAVPDSNLGRSTDHPVHYFRDLTH